jgi:hypothetical protein
VLTICSLKLCSAQEAKDLSDPADTSSAIDLAEVPLGGELFRGSALVVQDAGLERRFSDEVQSLQRAIDQSVSDTDGCLLKIRMYANPDGAIAIPGGQLIAFAGIGKTPIDALVNNRNTRTIVATESLDPPFKNESYYIWIKKEHGKLKAGLVSREWRETFEKDANDEYRRRTNMSKVDEAMKSAGVEEISRDRYWSDLAQRTLANLRDDEERRKVKGLVQEFATAQSRFNEAYGQFVQKEQELRDQQQSLRTLQMISRIGSVISSAIQAGELKSANHNNAGVSAAPSGGQDATKVMIEYHEKRIDSLTGDIYEWGQKMDLRGASLRQVNDQLVKAFQNNGITIPDSDQKLALPLRPRD